MANLLKGEKDLTLPKYPKISSIDTYHPQSNQYEEDFSYIKGNLRKDT